MSVRARVSVMLAVIAAVVSAAAAGNDEVAAPSPARARELFALLRQDCGSCHGMRLTGGLGPALTPQSLQSKSPESLAATIVLGRAGTPMPPWGRFISEPEAKWLVARMLDGNLDAR